MGHSCQNKNAVKKVKKMLNSEPAQVAGQLKSIYALNLSYKSCIARSGPTSYSIELVNDCYSIVCVL